MKKAALFIALVTFSVGVFAQNANDKRGFKGVVNASSKQTIRPEGKENSSVNVTIEFTGRSIVVEGDTYEIVKKAFDGKKTTVFTCSKRRGTFDISYTAGESIQVVDTSNKDIVTVYQNLKE
ncbi:MAG: hypothetical protein ABJH04_05970 [Cyclobacteriaceae bacterium]